MEHLWRVIHNQKPDIRILGSQDLLRITKQYKQDKAFENKIQNLYEQGKEFEITEAYRPRVERILEAEWKNFLEAISSSSNLDVNSETSLTTTKLISEIKEVGTKK